MFCGAGGLTRGLIDAGFDVVGAIDNWEPAIRSYATNFQNHPVWQQDISQLDRRKLRALGLWQQIDLLAGGPPCQGFSIQRIGEDKDERNDLILAFARLVVELEPAMMLMENVPGLLGRRGKQCLVNFVRILTSAGYELRHAVVNAAAFGAPQIRRRVFFVGWRRGLISDFAFPEPMLDEDGFRTVRAAIGDLPSPPADFTPTRGDPLHRRIRLSATNLRRLALIPPGGGFESLPTDLRVDCHRNGASRIGHRYVYGRLDPDRPAGTITARFDSFTRGRFGHPWENRNITLREGARLQSFPDSHVFLGTQEEIAAQIGNAVPPILAQALGQAISRHICQSDSLPNLSSQPVFDFTPPQSLLTGN
jgi:DNA (cytosine-5)-methyltransferase 1